MPPYALTRLAERARQRADYEDCHAQRESIVASAMTKVASCKEDEAKQSECEAKNESHTAHAGIGGCVLGILGAALSAGAGTPLALAGCGAGLALGHATRTDCRRAECDASPEGAMRSALAEHGAAMLPMCGGVVGVNLREGSRGVEVVQVDPAGPAAAAGVIPGDVLAALNGKPVPNLEEAARATLDLPAPGDAVPIIFVRRGQPFQLQVPLAARRPGQLGL